MNDSGDSPIMEVRDLGHAYGDHEVLRGLNFTIGQGELMCIVGPSGAGKTTLLNCLTGLRRPSSGEVLFEDKAIAGTPRGMAVVFQDYSRSLMPWLRVEDNVMLPLRSAGVPTAQRRQQATDALAEVGLAGAGRKYPWQLSGGMQQRVAIARGLAYRPEILIMDEPFASVDAQTRFELEDLCLRIREQFGMTILVVTHDIDEAVYLSDRVVVLGSKPAHVVEIVTVDLPRERDQITTRATKAFVDERTRVLSLIKNPHRQEMTDA